MLRCLTYLLYTKHINLCIRRDFPAEQDDPDGGERELGVADGPFDDFLLHFVHLLLVVPPGSDGVAAAGQRGGRAVETVEFPEAVPS